MNTDCPSFEANLENCPCTKAGCVRKGRCCECIRHHTKAGTLPACARHLTAESS